VADGRDPKNSSTRHHLQLGQAACLARQLLCHRLSSVASILLQCEQTRTSRCGRTPYVGIVRSASWYRRKRDIPGSPCRRVLRGMFDVEGRTRWIRTGQVRLLPNRRDRHVALRSRCTEPQPMIIRWVPDSISATHTLECALGEISSYSGCRIESTAHERAAPERGSRGLRVQADN
jgi:hypothetical protein